MIASAAIFLACKVLDQRRKLKDICAVYHKMKYIILGTLKPTLEQNDVDEISKLVVVAESKILRTINYDFNFQLPYSYLTHYCETFYPGTSGAFPGVDSSAVHNLALAMVNDCIATVAPLMYHARTVALACVLMAANYLELPAISDEKYYRPDNWLKFKMSPLKLPLETEIFYSNLSETEYLAIPWYRRVHPGLSLQEIEGIIVSIKALFVGAMRCVHTLYQTYLAHNS